MCQRPLTTVFEIKDFFVYCVERIVLTITRPGRTVLHYICFDLVLTTKVFFLIKFKLIMLLLWTNINMTKQLGVVITD